MNFLAIAKPPLVPTPRLSLAAFVLFVTTLVILSVDNALTAGHRVYFFTAIAAAAAFVAFTLLCVELAVRSRKLERQTKERDQLAEALRESEARFRDFALTTSDWFWETDRDHRFTYTSDDIRGFGQDPGSRIGRTRIELAADADTDQDKWLDHMAALNRHEPFRDFVYTRKIGVEPEHILSISGRPSFDSSGRFLGYRGTARNVTDKVQGERRAQEAKLAAEAANLAKSQFLANMSHELRTPLNAIIGFSEMLGLGICGPLQPTQQEYAQLIQKSGTHLLNIINDVLDLAKIDAGKLRVQEQKLEPLRLITDCIEIVGERAKAGSVQLSIECNDSLPHFFADATRLKQALLNLISNAIKFTNPGGSVVVRAYRIHNGDLAFQVRDTGIGMTRAEVTVAMDPFGQIDAGLNRRHQGTGLGLPITRSLVELHGGLLHIDSQKGRGTTVTVTLPATRLQADAQGMNRSAS